MTSASVPPAPLAPDDGDSRKWRAFGAIAISFVTMVMSQSMVFVALSAIADDFGVTLRVVAWVVISEALTISALMMPMGRLADIVGWKRIHLIGLVLFGAGAALTGLAGSFALLIVARVVMAVGNAMGQSVGTAMIVAVFPREERGTAIGSQSSAVAIGGASGPIVGGLLLQFMPWQTLFLILLVPIGIAFVAGYLVLDDRRMQPHRRTNRPPFDWGGAALSSIAITVLVIVINNPRTEPWLSPAILGGLAAGVILLVAFVFWEMRATSPMLEVSLFRNRVFSLAIVTRLLGFTAITPTRFLMPIYLISLRGLEEGAAGGVLFLSSLGMGIAGQAAGRLSDRFGSRLFTSIGFVVLVVTSLPIAFITEQSSVAVVMVLLFVNGLSTGMWNVPNNSVIMGSVPASRLGVVGAFTNLTRNVGNVAGQAVASAVVVAIMAAHGFEIPLSKIAGTPGASDAFLAGWRASYLMVTGYAALGLVLAMITRAPDEARDD
jgi:EmrB/QacA subfamily drug resistance transporter